MRQLADCAACAELVQEHWSIPGLQCQRRQPQHSIRGSSASGAFQLYFAQLCGENASLYQTTTLRATSLSCSSNSTAVMFLEWRGGTLTEPLNPQNVIHDHSFKHLRKENKYLYRLLSSKRVDQEHQKVLIVEADHPKSLRKHPQNPYSLMH